MTLPILLLEAAEADLADAKAWYRQCHPSLESNFLRCVEEALGRIGDHPLAYPAAAGEFRMAIVHRFPYRIVYRPTPKHIIVVAIVHTSRDPRVWFSRTH
jgi:plasmid stabilization system protein ParE